MDSDNELDNPEVEEQCKDTQNCKGEWEQMERTASRRGVAWRCGVLVRDMDDCTRPVMESRGFYGISDVTACLPCNNRLIAISAPVSLQLCSHIQPYSAGS
jgi:hypothetical protein